MSDLSETRVDAVSRDERRALDVDVGRHDVREDDSFWVFNRGAASALLYRATIKNINERL